MPTASEIATFLGGPLVGPNLNVLAPASLGRAMQGSLVFASRLEANDVARLNKSGALVLVTGELAAGLDCAHIVVARPRLEFARVLDRYFRASPVPGVARSAIVSPEAVIAPSASIGEFCVIGPGVVIGEHAEVRDHVILRENTVVGAHSLIKSHTVIGEEGFGYEFLEDGTPLRIVHRGRVRIGDHVEIGALNVIARGTLDDTVIADHVKTDDHVFIAHNAEIGEGTVIIAGSEISGSVKVGRRCWIAPQASVLNQVRIGDHAMVGIGAVVTKDVPANTIVVGNPAKPLRQRYERVPEG